MSARKMKRVPVEYEIKENTETGFYVVCNDKMILDNINHLMKDRGFLGVSDMSGRMHYMIDARKNVYSAVHHILQEVTEGALIPSLTNREMKDEILVLFDMYQIDTKLIGGRLLRDVLFLTLRSPTLLHNISKSVYPAIAKRSGLSSTQVERDIRYAIHKSELSDEGFKNVTAIRFLHDCLTERILAR